MRWSLLLLAGCMPHQPDPGGVEMRGRHITVHADPAVPVCTDAIAVADRFVEDTAAALGVTPQPIDYYLVDGPTGCGYGQYTNSSCTLGRTVYANIWIQFHELVHAVDDTYPPALFVEGLAVALSTPSSALRDDGLDRATAHLDLDTAAFRAGVPAEEYRAAGDFMRFVVERFGGARYETFAHEVLSLSDPITIRREFARVFGVTLDDVIADWRATDPADSTMTVPIDEMECHDPIAPVGPETWRVDAVVPDACLSGTTMNGTTYSQPSGRYGFEVTQPGTFVVEAAADAGDRQGFVRSCTTGVRYEYGTSGPKRRFMSLPLAAGRHAMEIVDGVKAWGITRLGVVGETCETAPTFAAPDGEWRLDIRGKASTWLRITSDAAQRLYGSAEPGSDARACWGACGDLHCQAIANGRWLEAPPHEPVYVVLASTSVGFTTVSVKTGDPAP